MIPIKQIPVQTPPICAHQTPPFSSQVERLSTGCGRGINPFVLIDPGGPSLGVVILVDSESSAAGSSVITSCCSISTCLCDGTSPLQYLCHMFLYADSRPRVNFGPSQTGDLDIRSRRPILKFESAVTSEANCTANWTYSSSFLAIRFPNPVLSPLSSVKQC